jgi:hypothetical protein
MFSRTVKAIVLVLAWMPAAWGHVFAQEDGGDDESGTAALQSRIDFGNAYIMGQSITSGSVYLLHRKKSDIDSMLKIRTDFRDEIIEDFSLEDTEIILQEAEPDKGS